MSVQADLRLATYLGDDLELRVTSFHLPTVEITEAHHSAVLSLFVDGYVIFF